MKVNVKLPQAAGIRRSVEVQHSTRGLGRMLRRGLHGGKNWVLEREEDGGHRSVWGKLFRLGVVLIPVLIVASAVTGGPERGGQSVSVSQSVFMALLVLLVGLGLFSARERRQGREEPWLELPGPDAESDESKGGASDGSASEEPTRILENMQAGELEPQEEGAFHTDKVVESEQKTQILPTLVPQATRNEQSPLASIGPEGFSGPIQDAPDEATSEGVEDHAEQDPRNVHQDTVLVAPEGLTVSLEKVTLNSQFEQVGAVSQEPEREVPQAIQDAPDSILTESDRNDLADTPTVPFRSTSRPAFPETESPQAGTGIEPIQDAIQDAFQCLYAERGPYPSEPGPVHESWWVVAPDVEPTEEPTEEPKAEMLMEPGEGLHDPWAEQDRDDSEKTQGLGPVLPEPYPGAVQRYFASRVSVDVDEGEKEAAREAVMAWATTEVNEGKRSQSEVARLLGVGKATVSRWVNAESDNVEG